MKFLSILLLLIGSVALQAQNHPAISAWLQNTTVTGTYYVSGNPTQINNDILVNCQKVEYSDEYVYVTATGIPAYPTGPFLDGNQSNATNQDGIWKIPLNPTENTGPADETVGGNIGIFINGIALFDYRDGVGWDSENNSLCGGPANPPCGGGGPGMGSSDWNRDAVPAEMDGFDCSKGHPAMGNYHHHQNPSAFKLDLEVVSDICNLYDADGLYAIDSTQHSPLIGYAYDGYPIYGAYGYKNTDGTGVITRINSSYFLRDITERTHHADGTDVPDGPSTSDYLLGYFREDYEFIATTEQDYLDVHNGRFCITPEYPNGTYAYFATVDENWNSSYPYVVGPTFFGNFERRTVNAVNELTTVYTGSSANTELLTENFAVSIIPNPASDLIAIQINTLVNEDLEVDLLDLSGKVIASKTISKGQTIAYFDVQTVYEGNYLIRIFNGTFTQVNIIVNTQ